MNFDAEFFRTLLGFDDKPRLNRCVEKRDADCQTEGGDGSKESSKKPATRGRFRMSRTSSMLDRLDTAAKDEVEVKALAFAVSSEGKGGK